MRNPNDRQLELIDTISRLMGSISQSELARRMQERGWDTYSQTKVSRALKGERTIGAVEYEDLLRCLGVEPLSKSDQFELAELRGLRRRMLAAWNFQETDARNANE